MGSSRSSVLGEACIDLADYADASKPTVVQLPLKGSSDSGAILHVTVQLLTSKTGFREFEQQREISERGVQASSDHDGSRVSLSGDIIASHIDKVSSRGKFRSEQKLLPSLEEEVGLSSEYADLAPGLDGSSNTSESLYAEKHDASGSHDVDSVKSTMSGDTPGISLSQSPMPEKGDSSNNRSIASGNNDWVHYYGSDNSVDHDLGIVYREDSILKGALEAAELSVHELKKEVTSLQTHTHDIGSEMQKLTVSITDDISHTNELEKNVSMLKSECSRLKVDIEQLRNLKINLLVSGSGNNNAVQSQLSGWLKSILTLEDKIRDIQSKTYIGLHDKDFRFLIPDLDSFLSILLDLKQGTGDLVSSLDSTNAGEASVGNFSLISLPKNKDNLSTTGFGMDVCQPEGLLGLNIPGLVSQETDATKAMQGEMFKLLRELDESKSERETLTRKMDQMECYYEALVQELEENQKQMLGELQNLRNEHSTCIYTLSSNKVQMEAMHQDMSDQILHLAEERCNMDSLNKELERRAISAEAALKRARLNYSIAVNQLQKDLEVLSLQVLSMYETNESLIRKAFSEVSPTGFEEYPVAVQRDILDTKDPKVTTNSVCQNHKVGTRNGGKMLLEDLNDSLVFQEELYKKIECEVNEINLRNLYLDVFARSLQETLQEAIADTMIQNCKINELMEQLELSMKSNESLTLKLRACEDDIDAFCKEKTDYISRENELILHNQALEASLRSLSDENHDLAEKITECEALVTEYGTYKSRYEACDADKTALRNSLEETSAENNNLVNKISLLQDEMKKTSSDSDELMSSKQNLQKFVDFLQQKLQNMLSAYDAQTDGVSLCPEFMDVDSEFKRFADVASLLENHQNAATEKMLQLMKEKKDLEEEHDIAKLSLEANSSELEALRKKFELDIGDMASKLEAFYIHMDNLQAKLDNVFERLKLFSEAEESCAGMKEELLSDIFRVEAQLHEISDKNSDIAREIVSLGVTSEELGGVKSVVEELSREKQDLSVSLQSKTNELTLLESETSSLKESLRSLTEELSVERNSRERLENELADVTSALDEKNGKLLHFEHQEADLGEVKLIVGELTREKQDLIARLQSKTDELTMLESEISSMKESIKNLTDELSIERNSRERLEKELSVVTSELDEKKGKFLHLEQQESELGGVKLTVRELSGEKQVLISRLQSKTDELLLLESESSGLKESVRSLTDELSAERDSRERLETELADVTSELDEKKGKLRHLEQQEADLGGVKLIVGELTREKQDLLACLQSKTDELTLLESEISTLKESLISVTDKLSVERNTRDRLENELADVTSEVDEKNGKLIRLEQLEAELISLRKQFDELELEKLRACNELSDATSQLNEKNTKLHQLEQQQPELVLLRSQLLDSESGRSRICSELLDVEKLLKEALNQSTSISNLQADVINMHEQVIASDIMGLYIRTQCECQIQDLVHLLDSSKNHIIELNKKNLYIQSLFDESLHREASYGSVNTNLQSEYESLKSQLEEYIAQNKTIENSRHAILVELEQCKKNNALLEGNYAEAMTMQAFEIEQLKVLLSNSLIEIDTLMSSRQELEIICLVLKFKLGEQFDLILLLEQYDNELTMLQRWCDELSLKLSEQTLKTEEFKNLSIHLKELKDKADAESLRAQEKKEDVVSSVAAQESLRIAFIKEQYETKVQELRQQLSISRKHGEEMLMKLQDAIDEVEKRRKTEASHLKRTEELSLKISELEGQLSTTLSDNRDKFKDYDQVKAELECSLISLECCKEEKQKLVVSLQECNDEKTRIAGELSMMRECLSSSAAAKFLTGEKEVSQVERLSREVPTGAAHMENKDGSPTCVRDDTSTASLNVSPGNGRHNKLRHTSLAVCEEENGSPVQIIQDDARRIQAASLESTSSDALSPSVDQLKAQNLKSSMDFLHKELEKMKSENSLLSEDDFEPHMEGLRRELIQLEKVNEELENMSPEFKDYSSYGNSIERVLALVMELAEALKAKKTSTLQFQSSFLKQHNDETAIFRSFKDINDLIKDMLDLKGKYNAVETELREMHERYSELSIQFAEVEGERQKLMMTLKNTRSPRRLSGWGSPVGPAS
ncbi:hypothetical protein V2J09_017313 [Rumex salicifolius]